jgi:hypothetical protein
MQRLKNSVNAGSILREQVFGIDLFESPDQIKAFLRNNDYPFTFIEAGSLGNVLDVQATPTIILVDAGRVVSMSSGMSLWGIWRVEFFLSP